MKKFLAILVLGLLWCNISFGLTEGAAINQYFKNRKVDAIEGIWLDHLSNKFAVYKSGNNYIGTIINTSLKT